MNRRDFFPSLIKDRDFFTHPSKFVRNFEREMDQFFNNFYRGKELRGPMLPDLDTGFFSPVFEFEEKNDSYLISMDLPGMRKEDISINLRDDNVVIEGERKEEKEHKGKGEFYSERRYGQFRRSFAFPTKVKEEKIEANFQDGVLKLYIPKTEPSHIKKIEVKSGKEGVLSKVFEGRTKEAEKHEAVSEKKQ